MLKGLSLKKVWIPFCLLFFVGLVLSKDCLSARLLDVYVSNVLRKEGWNICQKKVTKDRISIQGLTKEGTSVGRADILCHLSLIPFVFEPEIVLSDVQLSLKGEDLTKKKDVGFFGLLAGNSFFNPKLQIERGQILCPSSENLFSFQFDPGLEAHKIGSLYIEEQGEEKPFLVAEFSKDSKAISAKLEIFEGKVFFLLPWISSLTQNFGLEKWDKLEGKIDAYIQCSLDKDRGLDSLQANIGVVGLDLQSLSSDYKMQAKSLQGTLSFSAKELLPIWKQVDLFLTFEDLLWLTKLQEEAFGFTGALGEIRLQPGEDPYLKVGGTLKTKADLMPFELEGSYEALEKNAYWLQSSLSFFLPHSQPKILTSFWQDEEGFGVLDAHWEQVGKEISDLYQEIGSFFKAPLYVIEKGEVEGNILAKFNQKNLKSVELSDLIAKNIVFHVPFQNLSFEAQNIKAGGLYSEGELTSLQAEIKRGNLLVAEFQVEDIVAKLEVVEGEFIPSYIEGSYLGTKVAAQVLTSSADALLHIECGIPGEDLKKFFSFGEPEALIQKDPILIVLDLYPEEGSAKFLGTVRLPSKAKQPQDIDIEGTLDKILNRKVSNLFSDWNLSSAEGVFTLTQLSAKTIGPYFPKLFSQLDLEGSCNLAGSFTRKKIEVDLSSLDLSLGHGSYRLIGQMGNKEPISLIYDKEEKSLEGRALVDSLFIEDKLHDLKAEVQDTFFLAKDSFIFADEWKVNFEGIELLGSFAFDGDFMQIASKALDIDVKNLQPLLLKYFPQIAVLPWEGILSLPEKGYTATLQKKPDGWDSTWAVSAKFSDLTCFLGDFGLFKQGQVQINTGSSGGFFFKEVKGRYDLGSFSSELILEDFCWLKGEINDFKLIAQEAGKQSALLKGSFLPEEEGFSLHLDKGSHVLGLEVFIEPISFKKQGMDSLLKGSCNYKWQQLPSYITLFKQMGFALPDYKIPCIEGDVQLQVAYDRKMSKVHLRIDTPEFSYEKRLIGKMACDLYHKEGLWSLESCIVGPYSFSGKMKKKEDKWMVDGLSLTSLEGKVLAEGVYDPGLRQITLPSLLLSWQKGSEQMELKGSFKGIFSLSGKIEGQGLLEKLLLRQDLFAYAVKKGTFFTVSSEQGLFLEKSQWDCVECKEKQLLAKLAIQNLTYLFSDQKLLIGGASIKVAKEGMNFIEDKALYKEYIQLAMDKEMIIQIDAELASDYKKMSGTIKNGSLDLVGIAIDLKNVQLLQENDKLYLSCQSLLQNKPVLVQWQSKIGDTTSGALILKEDVKDLGLCIQVEKKALNPWAIHSVEGVFQGLDIKMQKVDPIDKKSISYNTQVKVDFTKLKDILPEKPKQMIQKWDVGQGYSYKGVVSLDPSSFKLVGLNGKVAAEEFGVLGKTFHGLNAKVIFAKQNFSLQDLTVEDGAGFLAVKTLEAKLQPDSGRVLVTAPLVHIKDFSPSLFTKGKDEGTLIKNISFYQVKGFLHDVDSFEATGALNFVKAIKKDFSFWDIPLNLIKDFGLDTGILNPVIGEADFILSRGRLYFTALKNMYSEGERSQFALANSAADSYLGLDGTWHVDLKMKQNVVLKLTEDLVLSIRGTVEKPKYSFKWQGSGS